MDQNFTGGPKEDTVFGKAVCVRCVERLGDLSGGHVCLPSMGCNFLCVLWVMVMGLFAAGDGSPLTPLWRIQRTSPESHDSPRHFLYLVTLMTKGRESVS